MSALRRKAAILWLIIGLCLGTWSLFSAGHALFNGFFHSGLFIASLLGLSAAGLAIAASLLYLRRRHKGVVLLKIESVIQLLYGLIYALLGGAADRSLAYSLAVTSLCMLALGTLFVFSTSRDDSANNESASGSPS